MNWIVTSEDFLCPSGFVIPAGSLAYVDLDGYAWGYVTQSEESFQSHVRDEADEPVHGFDTHGGIESALAAVVRFTNR